MIDVLIQKKIFMSKCSSGSLLLFLVFVLLPIRMVAFDGGLFRLQGVVVDASNGEAIPGVAIVCKRTGDGVISNEKGEFSLEISWSDSLIFMALTYENLVLKPPESLFSNLLLYRVELKATQHQLNEVEVTGEERIPIALRSDVFKEKPKVQDYFFRPISVIYYYASKRERRKRLLLRMIEQEELMVYYENLYNREVIAKYSGLVDRDLDYCIIYCNSNIELKHGESDEVVKWKIMNVISDYYKQKGQD